MKSYSAAVSEGMKRICGDFSPGIQELGFVRTKNRLWVRTSEFCGETVYLFRLGSTYGAPSTASINLRVTIGLNILNDQRPGDNVGVISDPVRRSNGYAYHHRFNAETWSTYDRCLDELQMFMTEFAGPWFTKWTEPNRLLHHPELVEPARKSLEEAIAGRTDPERVRASLKALGVKTPRSTVAKTG